MGVFLRIGIITIAICLDMVLSGYFGGSLISPNVTLMLVVAWSLLLGFTESIGWVMLAGVLADMVLFRPLGFSIFMFVVAAYASSFLSKRFFIRHPLWILVPFFGVVIFSVCMEILAVVLFWGVKEGGSLIMTWIMHGSVVMQGLLILVNAALFFLSYRVLDGVETFLSYYKRRVQPKKYV